MTRDQIKALTRAGRLVDHALFLKPTSSWGRSGVRGGYALAVTNEGRVLFAVAGFLPTRHWVTPIEIERVESGGFELRSEALSPAGAHDLLRELETVRADLFSFSRAINDVLVRFGLHIY